eukprot:scaffold2639_cov361-Pavlova_lutheri.AAC.8
MGRREFEQLVGEDDRTCVNVKPSLRMHHDKDAWLVRGAPSSGDAQFILQIGNVPSCKSCASDIPHPTWIGFPPRVVPPWCRRIP